jgi:nucleotide-binding universal stress UspA family protein
VFERILWATTETKHAAQTMKTVAALAKAFSADVTVYHARVRVVAAGGMEQKESIPEANEYAEHTASRLLNAGVQATPVFESVKPAELANRILAQADATRADLIILGSHHSQGLRETVFGDIGKTLSHHARCPVLLMPSAVGVAAT